MKICTKKVQILQKKAKNMAKKAKNRFFFFRPPFFAEKQKIGKKRKTKIFRFGGSHRANTIINQNYSDQ